MTLHRKFLAGAVVKDETLGERQIRVVVSTPTPDRVKDVMDPAGCVLDGYRSNPIVLAGHDRKSPIGTAAIEVKQDRVEAVITFAPAGISVKADEYCGLAKAGILNTVSPGFQEIEAAAIKGGGIHYKRWELLELSLVAVPAQPEAVVIGRSLEQSTQAWKCGASLNLLVVPDDPDLGNETGLMDRGTAFARKAFLAYAAAGDEARYAIPFAVMKSGRLVTSPMLLDQARDELEQRDGISPDLRAKAQAVIDHYEDKMKQGKDAASAQTKTLEPFKTKDMYDCGDLAYAVQALVRLAIGADWEREIEGDASPLPEKLAEIARAAGEALVAMVEEEVGELMERLPGSTADEKAFVSAGSSPALKALRAASLQAKAGRTFSSSNAKALREACKSILTGHDAIKALLDQNSGDEPDGDDESGSDTGKGAPAVLTKQQRLVEVTRRQAV